MSNIENRVSSTPFSLNNESGVLNTAYEYTPYELSGSLSINMDSPNKTYLMFPVLHDSSRGPSLQGALAGD